MMMLTHLKVLRTLAVDTEVLQQLGAWRGKRLRVGQVRDPDPRGPVQGAIA